MLTIFDLIHSKTKTWIKEQKEDNQSAIGRLVVLMEEKGKYKVEIEQYFSPYLKTKIDDFNAKRKATAFKKQREYKPLKLSESGLEMIESVQFDTTLKKDFWTSNPDLEDKADIKSKVRGEYYLTTDIFKIKIRNIAGDEMIIDSESLIEHARGRKQHVT